MYPFASLPDNLAAFCAVLRARHGFRIGPGELEDAARALVVVDLADERVVRDALRPTLSGTLEDVRVFDAAFSEFFHPGPVGLPQPGPPGRSASWRTRDSTAPRLRGCRSNREAVDDVLTDEATAGTSAVEPGDVEEASGFSRSAYSPLVSDDDVRPEIARADAAWRAAATAFVRSVQLGLSRRWRPAARGLRFDLRRTLRVSLQTGGELLAPRWLCRPRRSPRFVLLIDGSRSMQGAAEVALRMAVALATVTRRLEVYTFSTSLRRVTPDVRRGAAGQARHLPALSRAWGGGTAIGRCLHEFLRGGAERALGRDTVVIITSDGLDIGDPIALGAAMRELRRKSAAIVWLNPLLPTPGYQPTAAGMRAAHPHITTFASVSDAAGLARLGRRALVRPV